jgi:glycosyltransferase involved in cell wall biosynthesis
VKVAIDLRPLQIGHQNRGIGAYLLNILSRLPEDSDTTYIFLRYNYSDPIKNFNIKVSANYKEVVLNKHSFSKNPIKLIPYVITGLFPSYGKLRRHRPSVFFQVDYLLGTPRIWGCRVVTVSHDLIPFRFKQLYLPSWRKYIHHRQLRLRSRFRLVMRSLFYSVKYRKGVGTLRRSDEILAVSQSTKNDLVELIGINPNKVSVIYSAASFRNNAEDDLVVRPEIKNIIESISGNFITYVGGTDLRRQITELVQAFNLYNARIGNLSLVLCGNEFEIDSKEINHHVKKSIKYSSYKHNIYRMGRVSEAEKQYILSKARAFVYPTLYEGFGLPVLEALACGTEVLTYRNSSLEEIAGKYAVFTSGDGSYSIYKSLTKLLEKPAQPKSWKDSAIKYANSYSWEKCANETWSHVLNR